MKDKKTLITIIILLIISLTFAIKGKSLNKNEVVTVDDNPSKDFIYNNSVYFYQDNKLIDKYSCKGTCVQATSTLANEQYPINVYTLGDEKPLSNLNNDYALFKENDLIELYNYNFKKVIMNYEEINNYNVKHSNPILIFKKDGKYGVLSLKTMTPIIKNIYDYVAIPNKVKNDVLNTNCFIVKEDDYWFVMDQDTKVNNQGFEDVIVDFNDNYIITKNDTGYHINDYSYNVYLEDMSKKEVHCIGDYVLIITSFNNLYLYNDVQEQFVSNLKLSEYEKIDFKLYDNKIDIYLDGKLNNTISL